jgi:hypothetical protein
MSVRGEGSSPAHVTRYVAPCKRNVWHRSSASDFLGALRLPPPPSKCKKKIVVKLENFLTWREGVDQVTKESVQKYTQCEMRM